MRGLAAAAALLLASCYEPGGQCAADAECLDEQVCDGGFCVPGTRPPPGQAPTANADGYLVVKNVPLDVAPAGVLVNDTDPDGAPLTAVLETHPIYGQVFLAPDGGLTYVPLSGWTGTDAFTYRATNGIRSSDPPAAVTFTVVP
jgi:hypothetical protein